MLIRFLISFSLCFFPLTTFSQDNQSLLTLFTADQAARKADNIDWEILQQEDAARREAVLAMLQAGEVKTSKDYYHAAMVFQHGQTTEEIRLAHAFATISSALENTSSANWLKAASWDRLLLNFDQPQWYGTQYVKDDDGKWAFYEVQPDVITDEQRAAWSVPSLQEAKARVEKINAAQ